MARIVLLVLPVLLICFSAGGTSAGDRKIYPGASSDKRIAGCGVFVSEGDVARIEPYLDGLEDLEGRLELDVTKRSPSGQSQSRQASSFRGGKVGATTISINGPAELAITLSVTDRSGKTVCVMRRSITIGSVPLKI